MRIIACLMALALSACTGALDGARLNLESSGTTMRPALEQQKLAVEEACLASIFEGTPLSDLMATMPSARQVPVRESGSPTATIAWRVGATNQTYVMLLPGGACSASVGLGNPQQLYEAALALAQKRGAFVQGMVDASQRGDAERTTFCTAGPYPYVFVIYKRTTGSRVAFLVNVFKAQGATFSSCKP